ncbi:MAG: hypothetical protein RH917_14045 [Lacipirellulaceae bacterium]
MSNGWFPKFVFASCQYGAEVVIKNDVTKRQPELRLAFSRPGFITFKLPEGLIDWQSALPSSPFVRGSGFSLGKVSGETASAAAEAVWELPDLQEFLRTQTPVDIHVWQRDAATPGKRGFEPGVTALSEEVRCLLGETTPVEPLREKANSQATVSPRNRWVLDIVLVEPNEWWIGCHRTDKRADCWPGGVPDIELPDDAASRAYLKMAESLEWSALPISRGDKCVEIGCAPGGAAQRLLESGLQVVGVDPAEVAESVLKHPAFRHLQRRAIDVQRKEFSNSKWLFSDINATPAYTLDAVEAIVTHASSSVRGMILTLKLTNWELAEELSEVVKRVKSWGYRDVRLRQLAFNGKEVCLVALRSRGQRRLRRRRTTGKRHRVDGPHSTVRGPKSSTS